MHRLLWDLIFLFVFSLGQFLFILKRADLARRSPLNGVKSIGQYFKLNWVVLIFRAAVEWGLILWPYRSWSATTIQWALQKMSIPIPFQIPARRGLTGAFFAGMVASSLLDWLMMQNWTKNIPIVNFLLRENIPQLPEVQQLVQHLNAN
jgi:hypothetical protein